MRGFVWIILEKKKDGCRAHKRLRHLKAISLIKETSQFTWFSLRSLLIIRLPYLIWQQHSLWLRLFKNIHCNWSSVSSRNLKWVFFSLRHNTTNHTAVCKVKKTNVSFYSQFIYLIHLICGFNYLIIDNNNFVSGLYGLCCYSNCVWCDKAHVVSLRGKNWRSRARARGFNTHICIL